MRITPMRGGRIKVEVDYDSPGGRIVVNYITSAEARAYASELVGAANAVVSQVSISLNADEINRQLENALRETRKLGWNKRKQQEQKRDDERFYGGTVREKPDRFINVNLGKAEAVAAAPVLKAVSEETKCAECNGPTYGTRICDPCLFSGSKCAKCGKSKHDGWCWL